MVHRNLFELSDNSSYQSINHLCRVSYGRGRPWLSMRLCLPPFWHNIRSPYQSIIIFPTPSTTSVFPSVSFHPLFHPSTVSAIHFLSPWEEMNVLQMSPMSNSTHMSKTFHLFYLVFQGVWRGPFVSSEFLAVTVALLVWYMAHSAKSKIQS